MDIDEKRELPIACSLSDTALSERLQQVAALGREALIARRLDATHAELRFAAGPSVRERVEAIVAAESRCCAFLTMRVIDAPDTVGLTIDAPAGAEPVLSELVDAFAGGG